MAVHPDMSGKVYLYYDDTDLDRWVDISEDWGATFAHYWKVSDAGLGVNQSIDPPDSYASNWKYGISTPGGLRIKVAADGTILLGDIDLYRYAAPADDTSKPRGFLVKWAGAEYFVYRSIGLNGVDGWWYIGADIASRP